MSRTKCTFCSNFVSTTCDTNQYEGWFVSKASLPSLFHALEFESSVDKALDAAERPRLVLCEDCQAKLEKAE